MERGIQCWLFNLILSGLSLCLLECPGGFQNPCNGHGSCLDGMQQNGTCICKVSARCILRVMGFCQRELYSICADALDEGYPSAWKVISSFFHSSISVYGFPGGLVWSAVALRHCWWRISREKWRKNCINLTLWLVEMISVCLCLQEALRYLALNELHLFQAWMIHFPNELVLHLGRQILPLSGKAGENRKRF